MSGHRWPDHGGRAGALARLRGDAGAATVFACLALAGLIAGTLMVGQVGVVVVTRHRAQAAADLAALAAAGALAEGGDAGCAEAGAVARRMAVRMEACEVAEWDATVIVNRNVPMGLLGVRMVRAVARAGPVED
ncbi:Rv3654c family TadE-like protein [Nocardia sp. NPDC050175]|uniref:Rv3654c family TadE-like protein n=1 Tax=Nocardia sp. NPDC050175 TaxID=3364317 RepID=UPI0037BC2640